MNRTVHVFSSGEFFRRGNTFYFKSARGQGRYLPIENVLEIFVHGDVSFNKRFLEFLSEHEITLHYFNHYGYYMGSFYPREHYNSGFMTVKQVNAYVDASRRMYLAKKFVEGSVDNMLRVIAYYQNRGRSLNAVRASIEEVRPRISVATNINELMAMEGNARERYYQGFDAILENTGFTFGRRTRRPPANELNSLISFGNSLIYTVVLSEIYKTHLDPRIGYLHSSNERRFSLNLDVAEIFKPIIVDRTIFTVVNKRMITLHNFSRIEASCRDVISTDFDS